MAERLSTKKLIEDLTGRKSTLVGAYFDESWHDRNAKDVEFARLLTAAARAAKAQAPQLLMVPEPPDSDYNDYGLEEILEHDEFDEDFESREERD
jgi:hypothetical protein